MYNICCVYERLGTDGSGCDPIMKITCHSYLGTKTLTHALANYLKVVKHHTTNHGGDISSSECFHRVS